MWGGVKQGRFVIFRFPLFCSGWGSQDAQMLGRTARKVPLSHPFLCAPNASKRLRLESILWWMGIGVGFGVGAYEQSLASQYTHRPLNGPF